MGSVFLGEEGGTSCRVKMKQKFWLQCKPFILALYSMHSRSSKDQTKKYDEAGFVEEATDASGLECRNFRLSVKFKSDILSRLFHTQIFNYLE